MVAMQMCKRQIGFLFERMFGTCSETAETMSDNDLPLLRKEIVRGAVASLRSFGELCHDGVEKDIWTQLIDTAESLCFTSKEGKFMSRCHSLSCGDFEDS